MRQLPVDRTYFGRSLREECEIIAALRAGDTEAWGDVYRKHRKAAQAAATRVVLDQSIAEDLTQEAFLILPQALRGFRGQCSLRTFIVSITHNLARHQLRAQFRRRRALHGYAQIPETRVVFSPEQLLVRRQIGATITRALATLPAERQRAFLLREHLGHTASETARLTRALEPTVRTRVHYARQRLREVLSSERLLSFA
jgi:RNA polymerase sigma-70 factor (ECF subfamily)